ncbi:MAG: hypothetical protein CMI60_21945 [Parvibaculum sp.]|nr:hypothetical protein [Parvibaculum sp.]
MTVSSTTTSVSYTGNGSTTSFAVSFPFQGTGASAEIEVIERTIATGAEATKSYSTHYTVTGGNGSTGTVVAGSAPADTVQWHIRRKTTQTQTTDYVANDPFPAETHETALDRAIMISQEQQSDIDKSVSFPDTYTGGASSKLPEPSSLKLLGWNSDADALENTTGRVSSVTASNVATSSGAPGTATASFTASTGALALGIPVGQTGMMGGVSMQYSTTTADADPGAGFIRLNNTSLNSATIMYVDDSDGTTDISAWVQSWDDSTSESTKGYITIAGNPNPASPMVIFKVTGAVTDASGYTKVPVSYVAGSTSMSNSAEISIAFSATGNAGDLSDPMTTRGDVIVRNSSNATARLAVGSSNTVLQSDGTDVSYGTVATAMIANNAVDETKLKDALVADFTEVTVAAGDSILLGDVSDSGNTKRDTVQGILDLAGGGAWTFISATTLSNDATYSFTSFDASSYDAYVFMLINVIPVTDGVYLDMLTSTDGGSNFDTGATDYNWVFNSSGVNISDGGVKGDIDTDDAKISLTGNSSGDANKIGSATGEHGVGGNIWLFDPASTKNTQLTWDLMYQSSTPESVVQIAKGGAVRDSAADVDAIRLSFSSGNMESGQINVYGVKNA